jgi:hypothetical protein
MCLLYLRHPCTGANHTETSCPYIDASVNIPTEDMKGPLQCVSLDMLLQGTTSSQPAGIILTTKGGLMCAMRKVWLLFEHRLMAILSDS